MNKQAHLQSLTANRVRECRGFNFMKSELSYEGLPKWRVNGAAAGVDKLEVLVRCDGRILAACSGALWTPRCPTTSTSFQNLRAEGVSFFIGCWGVASIGGSVS
jgi:hypothetical protein